VQLKKREMRNTFSKLQMRIEEKHHKNAYFEYDEFVTILKQKGIIPT